MHEFKYLIISDITFTPVWENLKMEFQIPTTLVKTFWGT